MKLQGYIAGFVKEDAKVVTYGDGKRFVAFVVEAPPDASQKYPTRVKCAVFGKDNDGTASRIHAGAAIFVAGEVSAEAYMPKSGDKPAATLKLFVKSFEVLGDGESSRPAPRQTQSAPAPGSAEVDDVPF